MPPPTACSSEEARQHRREGLKAAIQRGEWGMGLHLKAGFRFSRDDDDDGGEEDVGNSQNLLRLGPRKFFLITDIRRHGVGPTGGWAESSSPPSPPHRSHIHQDRLAWRLRLCRASPG